jgi:hypothetical protein
MSRKPSTEPPPWPVAPRPFPDEPLGSWLGRVASAYRLTVEQLWSTAGLAEALPRPSAGWLLTAGLCRDDRRRLAALARLDAQVLEAIEPPQAWAGGRRRLAYCFACLVLNPLDVAAPRWKREWLSPEATSCSVHDRTLAWVTASFLTKAGHFKQLHRTILKEHHRAKQQQYGLSLHLQDWWTYSQH